MHLKYTTPFPNEVLDRLLPKLSGAEYKILSIIIRQTYGWIQPNGKRKERDRISYSQFITKSNLSRRIIATSLQSLIDKGCITIEDYDGNPLDTPVKRKGKLYLYFRPRMQKPAQHNSSQDTLEHQPRQKPLYNKTKDTKYSVPYAQGKKFVDDAERLKQLGVKSSDW